MIWTVCRGLLLGYFLAGPRKDPVVETQIVLHMMGWRTVQAIKGCGLSMERVAEAFRQWQVRMQAYRCATEYQGL